MFHIHRWTGIVCAIPLAIILISGTVAVYKDEIDEALNPSLLVVQPGSGHVPIDSAFAAVNDVSRPVTRIELPALDHQPYSLFRPGVARTVEQVAVDPYRGAVLGARRVDTNFAYVLRQIHLRFYYFGATGRIVVGVFGVIMLISGITGLILYPRFIRAQKWHTVRWSRGPQWVHSDLHKLLGIATLLLNILWAFTGAVLGLENLANYHKPTQRLLHPQPSVRASSSILRVSLDGVVAKSRVAIEGFVPSSLTIPIRGRAPLVVYGNTHGGWTSKQSSWVAFDASTGAVLETHDEGRARMVTQVYNLHDPLHFGYFAGQLSKGIWFLFGILVSALPVTGIYVWWFKMRRMSPHTGAG